MRKLILTVFAFLSLVCAPVISYAQDVKIGVLYPLTGPVAQVGKDAVAAVKTALDIINNSHNIPGMPLAKDAGLKGLGGGKISIVVGDHGGKPDVGVGETEKMLNSDKVHAMFGAYYSSVTGAASQVSERAGIPWVNGESTSPKLTTRGFKYFFRVTPHDGEFTQLMFEFMNDFNKKNSNKLKTLGIIHEDTLWGSDSGGTQNKMAKDQGLALNPSKISGVCGRLMCCLQYEHDNYKDLVELLPKTGSRVETPEGWGKVVKNNILEKVVTVLLDDESYMNYHLDELKDFVLSDPTEDEGRLNHSQENSKEK